MTAVTRLGDDRSTDADLKKNNIKNEYVLHADGCRVAGGLKVVPGDGRTNTERSDCDSAGDCWIDPVHHFTLKNLQNLKPLYSEKVEKSPVQKTDSLHLKNIYHDKQI